MAAIFTTGKNSRSLEHQDDRALRQAGTGTYDEDRQHREVDLDADEEAAEKKSRGTKGASPERMFPYCSRDENLNSLSQLSN
jgi:hypothetical protein